jgi:hypothetical protein
MRRRASREDDLPIDFIKRRVVIFFGFIFLRVDCGAEDKLKLSDDVIEEALDGPRQFVELCFYPLAILWPF